VRKLGWGAHRAWTGRLCSNRTTNATLTSSDATDATKYEAAAPARPQPAQLMKSQLAGPITRALAPATATDGNTTPGERMVCGVEPSGFVHELVYQRLIVLNASWT